MTESVPSRKVTCLWRGATGVYQHPEMVQVEVLWICPTCRKPRGEPASVAFKIDDQQVSFDRWHNACGHVDLQRDIVLEGHALQRRREEQAAA